MSAEYVACLEDVLDLYAEPYDALRPVVNFDEKSKQLVAEKRAIIAAKPGRVERFDYEYRRHGVANLFAFCEARAGWRHIAVTERHTKQDFAAQMKWLVDEGFPQAERIRVVMDNAARSSSVKSTRYFFMSGQTPVVAVNQTLQVQRAAIKSTVTKN